MSEEELSEDEELWKVDDVADKSNVSLLRMFLMKFRIGDKNSCVLPVKHTVLPFCHLYLSIKKLLINSETNIILIN